jgi:6-phosphofructokinase
LIPEVPFKLYGENGMFGYLEKVLSEKGHAVLCVAEGAAQDLLATGEQRTDASGNPILKDVGVWLKDQMKAHMKDVDVKYIDPSAPGCLPPAPAYPCPPRPPLLARCPLSALWSCAACLQMRARPACLASAAASHLGAPLSVVAGYIIRSIPTTSGDRIYCKILAHNAVHAAFAGYTGVVTGLVNTHYVYLPIPTVIQAVRRVDPRGKQWNRLRASIGQPSFA